MILPAEAMRMGRLVKRIIDLGESTEFHKLADADGMTHDLYEQHYDHNDEEHPSYYKWKENNF
jgi:hypothetical protein